MKKETDVIPIQQKARVLWNRQVSPDCFKLGLACKGYETAVPGQFVMLQVSEQDIPLLRRPFSIHGLLVGDGGHTGVELLYKVVGEGTRILSNISEDQTLDILGPLGNGFLPDPPGPRIFMVGGGIGVPPLVFLAKTLDAHGVDMSRCHMFLGGRTKADLLCREDFQALGISVHLTTDDGSEGDQCLITHPVEQEAGETPPDIIYACGPLPMLACLADICREKDIRCQVSIESMMACGIGACLGCAVEKSGDADAYFHVCKDGPVFEANQLRM
jgi:dihydroorotate dehydrogenase electron transfer subunit